MPPSVRVSHYCMTAPGADLLIEAGWRGCFERPEDCDEVALECPLAFDGKTQASSPSPAARLNRATNAASAPRCSYHWLLQQLVAVLNTAHSLPPCAPSYLSAIGIDFQSPWSGA